MRDLADRVADATYRLVEGKPADVHCGLSDGVEAQSVRPILQAIEPITMIDVRDATREYFVWRALEEYDPVGSRLEPLLEPPIAARPINVLCSGSERYD